MRLPRIRRVSEHTFLDNFIAGDRAVIVDLGMNHGAFSRDMRKRHPGAVLHGCEPVPSLHENLKREFGAAALNCAVGGRTEISQIKVYEHYCPSIVLGSLEESPETISIPVLSLDDFFAELRLKHVDLLKVDIEGSELAMLQNASAAALLQCDQITVEFHDLIDRAHLPAIQSCISRLQQLGFVMFRCSISSYADILFVNGRLLNALDTALISAAIFLKHANLSKMRNFSRRLLNATTRPLPAVERS